jgi:hypothetical protein
MPEIEDFARTYFGEILENKEHGQGLPRGIWLDIYQGKQVQVDTLPPSLTGWLPSADLLGDWRKTCLP